MSSHQNINSSFILIYSCFYCRTTHDHQHYNQEIKLWFTFTIINKLTCHILSLQTNKKKFKKLISAYFNF